MKIPTTKKGFTIIELMVVVAIIAILSSIGVTQFSAAQQKSRDAKRLLDVKEIKKALSLYQADNVTFPKHTTAITITGEDAFSLVLEESGAITEVPQDPLADPTFIYTYQSNSGATDYDISFCLETDTIFNYSQGCGNILSP